MSTIGKLLGRSPFNLLQRHMEQVAKCVDKMDELLDAFDRETEHPALFVRASFAHELAARLRPFQHWDPPAIGELQEMLDDLESGAIGRSQA